MQKLFLLLVLVGFSVQISSAQNIVREDLREVHEERSSWGGNYPYSVGPFVTLKGGVNAAEVPNGIKNGFTFVPMPDIGITGYIPLADNSHFGLAIDLAYTNYAYDFKLTGNEDDPWTEHFQFFTFAPNLYISGFTLGIALGFPLGGEVTGRNEYDIDSDDIASFIAEFKLGAMIPLYANKTGRINLLINAGYMLTGVYNEDNINSEFEKFNPHPASASLGISYLFNLTK